MGILPHGQDILINKTHHEAGRFMGVYNQTHSKYQLVYVPVGRNGLQCYPVLYIYSKKLQEDFFNEADTMFNTFMELKMYYR